MPFSRFRAFFRQRIRNHVTLAGVLFLLALGLTGAASFVSGNNLLFLIFAAMLALLLVSGFLSRLVLSGLELELLLPEHVSARTPTAARLRLRNLKRFTPSFSIELSGRPDPLQNTPSILPAALYFPLIPGRAVVETAAEVVFPRRGRHRENLFVLSTRFPFGFLRKSTTVALHRETIVYPSLQPDESVSDLIDAVAGEIETHFRGAGRDFYRIRPYESQDSARHVDWKATAHTGALQVREFTRDDRRAVEVYLDRRVAAGENESFERQIERCAWLLWSLADLDTRLCLRSQRFSLSVPEEGEIYDMLRFLSLVEPIFAVQNRAAQNRVRPEVQPMDGQLMEPPFDDANLQIVFTAYPLDFEQSGWSGARVVEPPPA